MRLSAVEKYLWGVFESYPCRDDMSNNGLQVEASSEISKVAFAVDACQESILRAADAGAQLLVVHHGISWRSGFRRVVGADAARFRLMFNRGVSLFAMHLPLDAHGELGNNAVIAAKLKMSEKAPFLHELGLDIGCMGTVPFTNAAELRQGILASGVSDRVTIYGEDESRVTRLAVVSGECGNIFANCRENGVDCLVTGEMGHADYHSAMENGVTVLTCGHYATETHGVKSLMPLVGQLGLETVFIDVPTCL